jgi:hypothetical protein
VSEATYAYGGDFMRLAAEARISAEAVIGLLQGALPIASVADFGCALGTWLAVWRARGVADVVGVDGSYVRREHLEIPAANFRAHELAAPIDLGRRFDLVESMEVAEHLPPESAAAFVATLARHGDIVLFSAAPPGQGGEHHVNEQPYEFWRAQFARHGYRAIDWIRPLLAGRRDVQYWYRFNLFLYASEGRLATLPEAMRARALGQHEAMRDLSPMSFRARKQIVRLLPEAVQSRISRALARLR